MPPAQTSFKITGGKATIKRNVQTVSLVKVKDKSQGKAYRTALKVKQMMNRMLETKFVAPSSLLNVNFNSGIGGPSEFYSIIPPIRRGTGSWQLLENQLNPISIKTTFTFCLSNVSRTQNLICTLYILKHKRFNSYPALVAGSDARILKNGQSTETSNYNGFIIDGDLPINNNTFTLLKKYTFRLISNVGLSNNDVQPGNAPNVDFNTVKKLSYVYKRKAPLKYKPDGALTDIYPENDAPFWCFGYAKVDGSAPDALNQNVSVSTTSQMSYKDA